MASAVKFQCFVENVAEKVHDLGANTLKIALTNSAPSAIANTVRASSTQISRTNGYTTGSTAITISSSAQSSGTYSLVGTDVVLTVSGGTMGPFRSPVMYNDTPTTPADPLIQY